MTAPTSPQAPSASAHPAAAMPEPELVLDWRAYDAYGEGDAYAAIPSHGAGFGKAAAVCIGSRTCQRTDAKGVMCPSFRATQDDTHSTRHRAATLRAAMNGELGPNPFSHPDLDAAMDLCVACKGCKRECPNGVDMALLRTEVLAQRWRSQPMPRRERLIASLPTWLPRLRRARALLALRRPGNWLARWMERQFGIAAARSLPEPAPQAFLDGWRPAPKPAASGAAAAASGSTTSNATGISSTGTTHKPREVLLLVDTFSNQLDPATPQAAVQLLQALGCTVQVLMPPVGEAPLCCGRSALSVGDVAQARRHAQRLLAALQPWLARGVPVLGLEPSCLLMLRDEYQSLHLGEPAAQAGKQAWLLEEYLAREFKPAELPAFVATPRQVLVHGHCHQKAFGAMKAMRKVLGWVPQLQVEFIESSCCGMAGAFGYEAEHHAVSMQMAEAALLPAVRAASPDAWLVANGTSCRHQIQDGAQRPARHFVHVLAAALPPAHHSASAATPASASA
jgi:glycerol-3-phosphate dehydrogenase subunit C